MHSIEHKPGKVLDVTLKGRVTEQDYDTILPSITNELNGNDVDGVLWDVSGVESIEAKAVWEDLKFDLTHRGSFERIAVVGDESWHKWAAKLFRPLAGAKVKYFDRSDRTAASEWVATPK